MFRKFFFARMPLQKQVKHLKKKGLMLGSRAKDGRRVYIFMLRDLFIEVIFRNDDFENDAEKLVMLKGLKNLNDYLENEFRTSF